MTTMTADDIFDRMKPHLEKAGLEVTAIALAADDDGSFADYPTVDVQVRLTDTDPIAVHHRMQTALKGINKAFEGDLRAGYYDASLGYDDIPAGEALLQFDCFPVMLDRTTAPKP